MDADRLTRLDRILIADQRKHGVLDLRPGAGDCYLVRTNRLVLIDRVKRLESFGVAEEIEPGRWSIAPWQPVLEKQIGRHISGVSRDGGSVEWSLGRNRGLGL